ncbi:hypothetical protein [Streptomyces sp. NEAU-W12]|uniref:hypothetical protein n=1 Tax=Streptomyces sp. NEAU-W12 TaxID=2994668 RepID=UPI00224B6DC6|nr:hypothetical protein [Streptomyces sp. NEAU-W12]MCX2926057.1 hypothetical protein [Streptomyces sp. NEAU-W12]
MTHQLRLEMAEELRDGHPHLDMRIACDTGPHGERGSLRAARLAWAAAGPEATHHLVLQDDVRLTKDFLTAAQSLIATRPDGVTSLFVEWGAWTASVARIAALTGAGWAEVVDNYVPTQAVIMPVRIAKDVSEYFDVALRGDEPDDVALRDYLRSAGLTPYVSVPNLVEHRDVSSLTGNHRHGLRCATCWASAAPPSGVDLRRSVTGIDTVPAMAWWGEPGAYFRIRDPEASEGWRKIPALKVLDGLGLSEHDVRRLGRHALRSEESAESARALLGEHLLFELWLASFSLGLRAADVGAALTSEVPTAAGISTPAGRRALATMALGAVRNLVPRRLFSTATAVLTPIVRGAVRLGLDVRGADGTGHLSGTTT